MSPSTFSFLLISLIVLVVVPSVQSAQNPTDCITGYDASVDYFPIKSTVTYAQDFTMSYSKSYKVLQNVQSNETFVLYQCGTPIPSSSLFPSDAKFFSIPVKTVWTLDTTSITFVEVLGKRSSIKAVTGIQYITSPCILRDYNLGAVVEQPSNSTYLTNSGVDVAFGYFAKAPAYRSVVSTNSETDPGIRNRAEWVKFYGAFFNLEEKANNVSDYIINNINCFQNNIGPLANKTRSPVVAFAQYASYLGGYAYSNARFKQQLVEYAGGTFYFVNTKFPLAADFLATTTNIDILIDETYFGVAHDRDAILGTYGVTLQNATQYKWINNVFREDGIITSSFGLDWFTAAAVIKDAVLADMINIVNNTLPYVGYKRIWLINSTAQQAPVTITAAACDNGNILDLSTNCAALPATIAKLTTTTGAAGTTSGSTTTASATTGASTTAVSTTTTTASSKTTSTTSSNSPTNNVGVVGVDKLVVMIMMVLMAIVIL